jgi:hypothetical protein
VGNFSDILTSGGARESITLKILEWIATGRMMAVPMVSSEPMRDMTRARNGT